MKTSSAARLRSVCLVAAALVCGLPATASAHPHVWVAVQSTVVYDNGSITGFDHVWWFDDMYSAGATDGLDKNGDGKFDREELAGLTTEYLDYLAQMKYFTHAKLGDTELELGKPTDAWTTYENGMLALHMKLPLAKPVLAEAPDFTFSVYDESYYIAFDLAKDDPIKLSQGAPTGCAAKVVEAAEPTDQGQLLSDAFGGATMSLAPSISVSCAKS